MVGMQACARASASGAWERTGGLALVAQQEERAGRGLVWVGLLDLIIQYLVRAAVGMKGVGRLQYH